MILGAAPLLLLPPQQNFHWTCPQYIGLFAMGMVGATINFSPKAGDRRLQASLPWGVLSALLFCLFCFIAKFLARGVSPDGQLAVGLPWTMDVLIGMAAASLIVFCTKALTGMGGEGRAKAWVLRPLESRWATRLGLFSYSIYLMSLPIEIKIRVVLQRVCHSEDLTVAFMFAVGAPLTLSLCYLFHLAFERRFMRNLSLPQKMKGEVFLSRSEEQRGSQPA